MKTIVSVTPTSLEADSRSFKIAATFARLGYGSVVVESQTSNLDRTALPFELRSMQDLPLLQERFRSLGSRHQRAGLDEAWRRLVYSTPALPFLYLLWHLLYDVLIPLKYIPRASLYYLHGHQLYPAVYILSKRYKAPIIYDAHDFYSGILSCREIAARNFGRRWMMAFHRCLESRLIRNASAVITVSQGVAELQEHAFGRHPIVIRNCHDPRIERHPPMSLRGTLVLSSDQFLVVVVGNCKPGMAIREALDAMVELPARVHLAFVGRFYEEHLSHIRQRQLQDRVHIVGPVKPQELVPFIRSADASVLLYYSRSANYKNCLPNGLFQAIAAGLPLLYPELPEIKRIAERYSLGIPIDPQVAGSIVKAVIQLMNNPSLSATFRRNLQTAGKELSWESEERILQTLISAALK